MKKTIWTILLFFAMTVYLLPMAVFATENKTTQQVDVAKYNNVGYKTIQEAITAAGNVKNAEIKVVGDIHQTNAQNKITVGADQNLVIDLDGHQVYASFLIYGKAVIKNGTIKNNDNISGIELNNNEEGASPDAHMVLEKINITSNRHAVRIDGGTASIKSGNYTTTGGEGSTVHAINISSNANVVIQNGVFEGSHHGSGSCVVAIRGENTILEILDGEYKNPNGDYILGLWGGSVDIKGGKFFKSKLDTLNQGGTKTCTISGGSFQTFDIDNFAFLQNGKAVSKNDDGWYTIVQPQVIVQPKEGYISIGTFVVTIVCLIALATTLFVVFKNKKI